MAHYYTNVAIYKEGKLVGAYDPSSRHLFFDDNHHDNTGQMLLEITRSYGIRFQDIYLESVPHHELLEALKNGVDNFVPRRASRGY